MRTLTVPQAQAGPRVCAGASLHARHAPTWVPRHSLAARATQTATEQRVADAVDGVLRQLPASRRVALKDVQGSFDELKQLGQELQLNRVSPEYIPGCFIGELTTDQNAFTGDVTNMARFTFGQIGPADLQVDLGPGSSEVGRQETGLPNLFRGPYDGIQNAYVLFTHFRVVEPDATPEAAPLVGVMAAVAEYGLVGGEPAKLSVAFRKLKLWPLPSVAANPDSLARWLKVYKPANASMDDSGVVEVVLPAKGPLGLISYLLMGSDLQVHVGNAGSHMILRRYTPPAGTLGAQLSA